MGSTATVPFVNDNSAAAPPSPGGTPYADPMPQPAATPPQQQPAPQQPQQPGAPQGPATEQDASQQPGSNQPVVLQPVKRGGILGVMDDIAHALTGNATRPEFATDNQGNKYVKETTLSSGEQWRKITGELLAGAAAGLAAGQGAGNMGKAPLAGIQAQQRQQQQEDAQRQNMTAEARQENIDRGNRVMQNMQMTKMSWDLTNAQHVASQDDVKFFRSQQDDLLKQGGKVVGTAKDPKDISGILKESPDAVQAMIQHGTLIPVQAVDDDGNRIGTTFIRMPDDYATKLMPAGTKLPVWNAQTHKIDYQNTADPIDAAHFQVMSQGAGLQAQQWADAQHKQKLEDEKQRSETNLQSAEAIHARAEAGQASATAAKTREETRQLQSTPGANVATDINTLPVTAQNALKGLADYSVSPETFPQKKYAKSNEMDRETAIGLAKQLNPDYDETQYKSRNKLRQDFASGQARKTINSLNTAVQHLDRMAQSGAALQNGGSQFVNAVGNWWNNAAGHPEVTVFKNDSNAVANELASVFKGTGATDQEIKAWKDTISTASSPQQIRGSIDEALQLMNGRLKAIDDQWKSGMGGTRDFHILSPASQQILQKLGAKELLDQDNSNVRSTATPQTPPPTGATMKVPDRDGKLHWSDGTRDLGLVQ